MTDSTFYSLDQFRFTAKIDYLSVKGLAKRPLPDLDGKAKWPRSTPGKLTVQDCSAADLHKLAELHPANHASPRHQAQQRARQEWHSQPSGPLQGLNQQGIAVPGLPKTPR